MRVIRLVTPSRSAGSKETSTNTRRTSRRLAAQSAMTFRRPHPHRHPTPTTESWGLVAAGPSPAENDDGLAARVARRNRRHSQQLRWRPLAGSPAFKADGAATVDRV